MPPFHTPEELSRLRQKADEGDRSAQAWLGYIHSKGLGIPRDGVAAEYWFRRAAEQGEPSSQYNLAISLYYGTGDRRDRREASVWFRKAADQGLPVAIKIIESNFTSLSREIWAPTDFIETGRSGNLSLSVAPPTETSYTMVRDADVPTLRRSAEEGEVHAQFLLSGRYRGRNRG